MNIDEGQETFEWTSHYWSLENYKRILYVGIHPKTFTVWGGDWFLKHIKRHTDIECTIVEISKTFVDALIDHPVSKEHGVKFVHSSIENFLQTTSQEFDCVIWWHGPEHLPKETSVSVIKDFEKVCPKGIIILGCPEGHQPYEEDGDRHYWDVYQEDFQVLGYNTKLCDRTKSWPGSLPSISACKLVGL